MKISRQFFHVNKKLLPVKIHYFLFMAAVSCAIPFRAIIAKQLGISATAVGIAFSVVTFLKIILNPIIGFLLDYFKRFRLIISVIMISVAVSHLALIFIPPREISLKDVKFRKPFKINVEHSCISNTVQEQRSAAMYVQSEWIYNDLKEDTFVCNVNCSDSATEKRENEYRCKQRFQFKLIINTTNCIMGIKLNNREMNSLLDDHIKTEFENESSQGNLYMRDLSSYQNITEVNPHPKMTSIFRNQNFNGSALATDFDKETKNLSSNSTTPHLNKGDNIKCYGELLYKIKFNDEIWEKNCPCNSKIMCIVDNCSPTVLSKGNDFPNLHLYDDEYSSLQFWILLILFIISSTSLSSVIFMEDTICYEILKEKRERYGQQRLWGTVGWGIAPLVAGYLNQHFSPEDEINYAPGLILQFILISFNLIPVYYMNASNLVFSSNIWKDVCSLLFKGSDVIYTMAMVYSIGVLSGFIWNYQFWFMEEIGASQILLGLSQTFECLLTEVPCFIVSGWIIKKIGYDQCNSITFFCFGLRYLYFAFMYDPWMSLPAALFHGPTFALFYASMTAFAKQKAPPGTEATMQALLSLFFDGLGLASGSFLGGLAIDKLGSRTAFIYSGVFSFILLIINIGVTVILPRIIKALRSTDTTTK